MSKPKLEGTRAKIERAKHHLNELQLDLHTHLHSEGASFRNDLQAQQHVFRYYVPSERFIHYAIVSGEVVGQARSALEHAIWEMSISPRFTGFPVVEDPADYKKAARSKVKGINKAAQAIIERLQPFNNGGRNSPLWILHDMWNTDKHKLLHIVVADIGGIARNYYIGGRFVQRFTGLPGKLEDGAEFRIDFPHFYDPHTVRMDPEVMVRLEFAAVQGQRFDTLLTNLVEFADNTVRALSETL